MDHQSARATEIDSYLDEGFFAWMAVWKAQALAAREIEAAMREHAGLSLTWGEVLSRLGAAEGARLPMNELASQVFVSRSGISQVVTAMTKHGLVERQNDPDNLRTTYAALTDHGRDVLKTSTTTFLSAIRKHFGRHLDPTQARTITDAMNLIIKTLGGTPDTPDATAAIDNLCRVVGADSGHTDPQAESNRGASSSAPGPDANAV